MACVRVKCPPPKVARYTFSQPSSPLPYPQPTLDHMGITLGAMCARVLTLFLKWMCPPLPPGSSPHPDGRRGDHFRNICNVFSFETNPRGEERREANVIVHTQRFWQKGKEIENDGRVQDSRSSKKMMWPVNAGLVPHHRRCRNEV